MSLDLTSLAPILSMLLVALGLVLPGILKRDGYSEKVNQVITFAIVLLASAAQAAVHSKLGPDFAQDFALVMTGMHVLLGVDGPFKSLDQFLQSNVNGGQKTPILEQFGWINQPPYAAYDDQITQKQQKIRNPQELPVVKAPSSSATSTPPPAGG